MPIASRFSKSSLWAGTPKESPFSAILFGVLIFQEQFLCFFVHERNQL